VRPTEAHLVIGGGGATPSRQSHDKQGSSGYGSRRTCHPNLGRLTHENALNLVKMAMLTTILGSCTTTPTTREGLQSEFLALNPARIAAFAPVLMPHPVNKTSIDPATVITAQVQASIETRILAAFKNQPNVNGVSFQTVRSLLKNSPRVAADIDTELKNMGQLVHSGSAKETLLLSKECRERKNFLDFYKHCMLSSGRWTQLLNQFSLAVLNSDSMLIPVLTSLEKSTDNNTYVVKVGISLLLIDTNTGRLIWGRDTQIQAGSAQGLKQFPELNPLLDKLFSEPLWAEFPGRRTKVENQPSKEGTKK